MTKTLLDSIILKVEVGSNAYGTSIDGHQDYDQMALAIEPWGHLFGLDNVDTYTHRPGRGPEEPSAPGDLDLVVYPLKHWCSLAAQGNPSVLVALWSRPLAMKVPGQLIRESGHLFVSKNIFARHIGYANSQVKRLEQGKFYKSRQKIVEENGYDTKFAMHAARLLIQAKEMSQTSRLELPMPKDSRRLVRDIRQGNYTLDEYFKIFEQLRQELIQEEERSKLPDKPDYTKINLLLYDIYRTELNGSGLYNPKHCDIITE
jgi:predicted nucleotidyltransferase